MSEKVEFTVQTYQQCRKEDWDSFVQNNDEAWFWHSSHFIEAWPYGENISFCIKKNDEILLEQVLFFNEDKTKPRLHITRWHRIPYITSKTPKHNTFFSVGGFARKEGLSAKQERKLQSYYVDTIRTLAKEKEVDYYGYCIEATCPKLYWPGRCPVVNPMVFYGYKNKVSQAYVIDLAQGEEDIFKGYVQTTRNLINRCKKDESIRIVEAKPTQEDLDKYYSLHVETYNRTGAVPHPKSYFEKIFFDILPAGFCHILFLYKGNQLIVAHNTLLYKQAAMYWTGCSISEKGDGETRLLMHEQIIYAKRMGCRYFEVGECFPNISSGKMKGLNDFKKCFGGFIHPIFSGEFDLL